MAVRTPLKLNGSDLQEMSTAEVEAIIGEAIRQYALNPSVTLTVVSSGGNIGTISDTRLQAGTGITRIDRAATTAELEDVSTVTVNYARITQSYDTSGSPYSNATYSYPLYYDAGNLREMSETDFLDTFIKPAIDALTGGSAVRPGTYHVSTSTSVAGSTLVSTTPIFTDTRANAAAYTAAGLIETRDQPTTIVNYYLHRVNAPAAAGEVEPIVYTKSGINLRPMPEADFRTSLSTMIRYAAAEVVGTKINYSYTTGQVRGTAMTDTKLNGSTYLTLYVNADDYRAQEVPGGTSSIISTYGLRIGQV